LPEVLGGLLILLLAPSPDNDATAGTRNAAREAQADTRIATRHDDNFSAHVPRQTRHVTPLHWSFETERSFNVLYCQYIQQILEVNGI
jgi:hypothetical protein